MLNRAAVSLTGGLVAGYVGFRIGETVAEDRSGATQVLWRAVPPLALLFLGVVLTPLIVRLTWSVMQRQLGTTQPTRLLVGTVGLFGGLLVATLLTFPLGQLPSPFGEVAPLIATLALAAAGVAYAVSREDDFLQFVARFVPAFAPRISGAAVQAQYALDTSAIIDGRVAEIGETGFIPGTLLVPHFILDELRHVADSADATRRARGRRGLELLARMQKQGQPAIAIIDDPTPDNATEVDSRLVRFARLRGVAIITNDYNLDRVAELQGVRVLNVNRLAAAVRAVVAPGEEMAVRVVQEGKESGQGVGFLEDGTMVVVENGRQYLNGIAEIVVTRVLQTASGRMVFAQPKSEGAATR